jgi:hypothetical protein
MATFKRLVVVSGLKNSLRLADLEFECCPSEADQARMVQVFSRLAIPGDGTVLGHRTTPLDDRDATKCIKSFASLTGKTTVHGSGGGPNSHQGPPAGSPIAADVRVA